MSVFADTFKTNDHWARYISESMNYKYSWAEGAFRSSKSISNIVAFCINLEISRDKLHLVIASTVASARSIVEDSDGKLGIKQYFGSRYRQTTYKGNDAGIIKTATGEKIVVYLGGMMKSSYQVFRGWSVGMIILEEADLLHPNTIREAKGRILMAKDAKMFISHNPTNVKHPIYQWLNELQAKGLVNYDHSTLYDNPALTDERRAEIIAEFDPDSVFFKQFILGERTDGEYAVYNIRDYNIIDSFNPHDYSGYITVADPGENCSATGFVCIGLKYDSQKQEFEIHVLKEYRHKNSEEKYAGIKLPRDYASDYCDFINECTDMMGQYPSVVYIDEDITFYRELVNVMHSRNMSTTNIMYVIKNDIPERIKQSINVLFRGKMKFYKECKWTIDTFKNAIYDPKLVEKGIYKYLDEPSNGTEIDLVDATCYGMNHYINKIYRDSKF